MADERSELSAAYPTGQLARALEQAVSNPDRAARARAREKAQRWERVLQGMASGTLSVGSRTPVAGTPAWVTLEVVHGGFATGGLAAEVPLEAHERELLDLARGGPGETDREKLNLWYLTDDGLVVLRDMLASGRYRVEVPEDGALPTVAWLLDEERHEAVLDLVAELRPWMDRLRLAPQPAETPRAVGATVRLKSAHEVARDLRSREQPAQITDMKRTLLAWNPLFDELVDLWADTVDGSLPTLEARGETLAVVGGWPCVRWPDDWANRRTSWLTKHNAALAEHGPSGKHHHPRGNYARLAALLQRCPVDSGDLSAREVGWIRRCLANTITSEGSVESAQRQQLRRRQRANAEVPDHVDIANVVADRLTRYPQDRGIPGPSAVSEPVTEGEAAKVPSGTIIPEHLAAKTRRAVEAPVRDLIDEGIITSAELLATVLPQMTAQVMSEGIDDPRLRELYRQVYGAFRRRRSLLLLDLEHQIRLEELPWVSALPTDTDRAEAQDVARTTLEQVTLLVFEGFPQTILPNPLVREMSALAERAGLRLPLVEEVAADIFMGTFSRKWEAAATVASAELEGTLYARYYDLPRRSEWPDRIAGDRPRLSWLKRQRDTPDTAEFFAARCQERATEAGFDRTRSWVASNGAMIEQSQILTTHNLAVLVDGLDLRSRLAPHAEGLAMRAFDWAIEQICLPFRTVRSSLQATKNAAYSWRQGIYFLSLVDDTVQRRLVGHLLDRVGDGSVEAEKRVQPVIDGLRHVIDWGRFQADGTAVGGRSRRLLGWSVGPHWLMPAEASHTAWSNAEGAGAP